MSLEYVANLKRGEEIKVLRVDISKEVSSLKSLIDFKKIIGIVHGNEKEFELIRWHCSKSRRDVVSRAT